MRKKKLPDTHLYLEYLLPIAMKARNEKRIPKTQIMRIIVELCAERELSISELSVLLLRTKGTLHTHYIGFMCDHGLLQRKFPGHQVQPKQKYVADRSVLENTDYFSSNE
ncbi:MAG: hypothetical protein PHV75_01115 [Victivallaceae bacterium]|jgi:hypothetical protein|nr:hypothetical protein [Victivallaceae bacterium]MDD3115871.1 hypothetical protein [Victivallaceae bacterium]MDD3703215.1 hypothetical protein [Victivallaceae bacterium]MDD4317096.1 hypothetical protein [Victivallaceae bacterium]MDD5662651.1 hypothetical protein [Victivallaceae bacterium]